MLSVFMCVVLFSPISFSLHLHDFSLILVCPMKCNFRKRDRGNVGSRKYFLKIFHSFTSTFFPFHSQSLEGKELVWHPKNVFKVRYWLSLFCSPGLIFGLPPCAAQHSQCHRGLDAGLDWLLYLQNDEPPERSLPSYKRQLQDMGEEARIHWVLLHVCGWDQVLQQADDLRILGLGTPF